MLIIIPVRLWHLSQRRQKVVGSWLVLIKLAAWFGLLGLQIAQTALWALPAADSTKVSVAANVILTIGVLALVLLSYAEHTRSVRPSFVLNSYLFCSLLFDAAHSRTLWLRSADSFNNILAIVATAAVGVKLVLFVLEAVEKRHILKSEYAGYPPEATAGFYNQAVFWWLNPLFKIGFTGILRVEDLSSLDKELSSERLLARFDEKWSKVATKSPNTLQWESLKTVKWPLLAAVPARACVVAFNFCQPLLLERSLSFFSSPVNDGTQNIGYGLIGAYVLVYGGLAISMGQYQHLTYRGITMVRGVLVTMLYKKASCLSLGETDPANSLTLMSADVERITNGWQTIHEIWANSVEIALAIYLLKLQLGISCVVPVCVALFALVGSLIGMSFVVARQAKWLEAIEKRISSTSGMLGSIKGVKMLGLQDSFMKFVHGLRISELDISKKFRTLLVYNMAFAWLTRIFAPIFTFGVYVGISSEPLSVSRAFTSLSLFSLLADPLLTLVMALMSFAGAVGSFQRIQQFLDKEDHTDRRGSSSQTLFLDDLAEKRALSKANDLDLSSINSDSVESLKRISALSSSNAVVVQGGSFGWEADKDPILNDITMTIPQGSFTVIIGPSGCGKSTLLKALLGEIPCSGGKVALASSSVAYCDQTPWHMNGTIKDSIVAMSDYDPQWYTSVIRACALEEDLAQFPRGDAAIIGSKGIALSGGQSQRIALARAVYARRKIMILDDALSGLDATTEDHIFHSLFGPRGLLKEIESSVIVASSSVKRLPYSDHIIVLEAGGRICEQGNFTSLNKTGGYVSSFGLGLPDWEYNVKRFSDSPSYSSVDTVQKEKEVLIEEPEHHDRGGDLGIYTYYINAIGWLPAIIFMVAMAGFVFCISFPSIWVKWWAQSDTEHPKQELGHYLGIYAMLGCVAMLALIVGCWQMIITMVPKSGENFHHKLLTTVLAAPMLFFSSTDSGSILNRFSQDLQLIDMELPIAAINTVATFFLCLAQMALIGVSSKYAAISFPIVLGILFLIQKMYLRTSRQLRFLDIEAKAPLYSHFTDCLQGLVTLRAFGWQHAMEKKNIALLDHSQRPFYFMFAIQRWLTLSLDMVVAGIAVLLIVLVVAMRGSSLSAGYVGVALLNVIQFSQSIKLLVTFWTNLETHIGSIQRIKDFTSTVESEDKPGEDQDVPPNWPSKGAVAFNSVSAAYRPSEPVLSDISLTVAAGEKVGICGRTGSGKTSMIMSIFRMVELTSGTITVDGVDISRLPRREIRSRINGVSQDSLLFQGSVRLNADPTGTRTDRDILTALKSVQLLPAIQEKGTLDTDIDEIHLSHGQKQLFCLARALLRPGNILILDEATSNIDTKTDEIMQRVIREKFCNHTIIAVAHKLDTILDFDRIVVLDAGRIVENGEPYALLAEPKSHFSRLYASAMATEESD
ncbi:ABC transporter, integral membrane type 1 [Penicillium griseofulvum]|uniref:ABC transporter, integral membrane type 1 n=1 Tax=Penicillium patulum TaxID=5078 RepID=A0A135L9K7_PENPA|nr:ABC transporter, integral membrane type 1 [Penicillium griseofulvum]KXG45668.1 ABC transporter, integral membrane type 1 [Penicillium griseofulvum]